MVGRGRGPQKRSQHPRLGTKSPYRTSSLCNLCVLCASVVKESFAKTTTETRRTQRLHREIRLFVQSWHPQLCLKSPDSHLLRTHLLPQGGTDRAQLRFLIFEAKPSIKHQSKSAHAAATKNARINLE